MIRQLFLAVSLLIFAVPALAENLKVLPENIDAVAPKDMMHSYLIGAIGKALDHREAEYEKLKTPEQLIAYQKRMREFFIEQLGGFPERTPLNARITGKLDCDGYRIEKIIFESRPKHFVTALLYLPDAKPPYPGVLVPCGHSPNGKACDAYQRVCILLAKNGMAVLCFDPIEQSERCQLLKEVGKLQGWGGLPYTHGTKAHCLMGVGCILLGRNTATYMIWDGMRAIDYLQSRPEVDPDRIGCTGNSGGGTLASYQMALDDRIKCAAPSCWLTNTRRLLDTAGPQDAEQNIHAQIAYGMDHADYVIMRAPKPTLMCTATHDFFDIGGSWDSFRQAKRFYTRMGYAERVDLIETDAIHGFSTQLRVGAVRWMRRWLLDADDAITEQKSPILSNKEALCTPGGQVMLLEGARSTYDINTDLEKQLSGTRKKFWRQTEPAKALEEVRRITGIRELDELPKPEVENKGTIQREGYRIDKLVIEPEPGIWLPALCFVPEKQSGNAYLYLHADGKHVDAAPAGTIEELVKKGHVVMAVDLRGLGETQRTKRRGRFGPNFGCDWDDVFLAYMLKKSYPAMWAEDALVCARWLAGYEASQQPNRVHLLSIGRVGPAALHAAALESQLFASVTLKNCLQSWSSVVCTPLAKNQFINAVHGALRTYDLPDLLATLPDEKVVVSEPLDAIERPVRAAVSGGKQ